MIEYIFLVLNIFIIILGLASLIKPFIFIASISLSSVLIYAMTYENISAFMVTLTIISFFVAVICFILGIVGNWNK